MFGKKYSLSHQKCPVCKSDLGYRNKEVFFMALCEECDHYYSWGPNADKPTALNRKAKERKDCGCSSCRALGR